MQEGDRIELFSDTDRMAYVKMIHNLGFNCKVYKNSLVVGKCRRPTESEKKKIGREITKGMKAKKLSREELSELIGANPQTIWNWQLGRIVPCKYYREKLCEVLEVEINGEV